MSCPANVCLMKASDLNERAEKLWTLKVGGTITSDELEELRNIEAELKEIIEGVKG